MCVSVCVGGGGLKWNLQRRGRGAVKLVYIILITRTKFSAGGGGGGGGGAVRLAAV